MNSFFFFLGELIVNRILIVSIVLKIMIIITCLTRVNPSAEAVINGCPGQV